ncbi:MAG: transcription elongation factor GreA [Thiovulaceae bacterium]|nr:transcription elongation factor GreA [Sulfurimonadaceae bacterium]
MDREPMTQEGFHALSEEFTYLNTQLKPKVNKEKQVAAEHGDRSENAEYHAAKEKLRHIDRRLKYLASLLDIAQIIDPSTLDHSRVCFGSTVEIEDFDSEEILNITISGVLESEPDQGIITYKAPLSKALLGKKKGDTFSIKLPSGRHEYEIISINYYPILDLKQEEFKKFDIL